MFFFIAECQRKLSERCNTDSYQILHRETFGLCGQDWNRAVRLARAAGLARFMSVSYNICIDCCDSRQAVIGRSRTGV